MSKNQTALEYNGYAIIIDKTAEALYKLYIENPDYSRQYIDEFLTEFEAMKVGIDYIENAEKTAYNGVSSVEICQHKTSKVISEITMDNGDYHQLSQCEWACGKYFINTRKNAKVIFLNDSDSLRYLFGQILKNQK